MDVIVAQVKVECVRGDITKQEGFDAVVNAANARLAPGGGVAGAIHRAAGPGLYDECKPLAPIKPGEAVITSGHNLPNRYVIHCLGPVYGVDKPEAGLLAKCYENALRLAERYEIESIAFPSISTGYFGYPVAEAAEVALRAVFRTAFELKKVKVVRFVIYSANDLAVYEQALAQLSNKGD
ncbi:MAG: macro domain-containing protein [bacterium]